MKRSVIAMVLLSLFIFLGSCSKNKSDEMPKEIIGTWASYPSIGNLIGNRFTITSTTITWYQWVKNYEIDGDSDECDLVESFSDTKIIYTNCSLYYKWKVRGDTLWLQRGFEIIENSDDWPANWRVVRE